MPNETPGYVIEVANVSKQIGDRRILDQVSLKVAARQICGRRG